MRALLVLCGALAGIILATAAVAEAAGDARAVEIRWDFGKTPPNKLQVWVDCKRAAGENIYACSKEKQVKAPGAYGFRLRRSDQITLVVISKKADPPGFATYAITGTNLDDKDLDALKKLFGADAAAKAAASDAGKRLTPDDRKADVKAVTDTLIAGGKFTVTFDLRKTESGKETTTDTSGPLTFLVESEPPRYTVSFGLGFSTAPNHTVTVSKTSTIVTFVKDNKTQQAYQQVIGYQDDDASLKPIQSLVTFANFHLGRDIYTSLGVQVNQKLFDGPMVGGAYRISLGGRRGANVFAGVHFSKETEIDAATGFSAGQLIDPTLGLTVGDIHTKAVWQRRVAFALTLDF